MDNQQALVNSYIVQGYTIQSQTESMTILIKKKKFKTGLFILLFCLMVLPSLLYLLYYGAIQKDERVQIIGGIVSKLE